MFSKLARHFEQKHSLQPEIAMILMLPKKSKERRQKFIQLLKKGDFIHNQTVIENKSGLIILCKRPTKDVESTEYLPCRHCFGMYLRKDLWRHVKLCEKKDLSHELSDSNHQAAGKMLLPISQDVSVNFKRHILSAMVVDEISSIVMTDPLILTFGQRIFTKVGAKQHQFNYVKQKLRELSRFLQKIRTNKSSGVKCLKDSIDPAKFKTVVASVKALCKCDNDGNYGIPSLALKIGLSLKKCALLLKSQALQDNDADMKQKAASFLELYESDWAIEISSCSLQTLHERLYNKPKRIPLAQDLKLFSEFLESKACTLRNSLEDTEEPCLDAWKDLNEVTLCQIVLFNRRRGGETERITVADYEDGLENNNQMQEEVFSGLSSFEKQLASTLDRIEIRGKRGRKVAVLLTPRHRERIDCLLKYRAAAGVDSKNNFLFARCGDCLTSIRSCDVLRKYAFACGAKQPCLLSSTSLRKHVATVSQILNLKNHELDTLANFLGHDINVHREFYRLPEDTVQLAKVSKLLIELENGKSLEQIDLDFNEELNENELEKEIADDGEKPENNIDTKGDDRKSEYQFKDDASDFPLSQKLKSSQRKSQIKRKGWSLDEKDAAKRQLGTFFTLDRLPGKFECEEAIRNEPVLKQRPWSQVKFFIKNTKVTMANQMKT